MLLPSIVLQGNSARATFESLLQKGFVVATPRLLITFVGPHGSVDKVRILDTGAKVNILDKAVAREIGCPISPILNFSMSAANS